MHNPLGTDKVTQIGIVVHDIVAARTEWAKLLGVNEPPIIESAGFEQAQTQYQDAPSNARAKLCFFNCGQVSIELIEPDQEPSAWRKHLDENGPSVQHIAFFVPSMTAARSNLHAAGIPTVQTGEYTGGRYAYVDSAAKLGVDVELLEND
jgi:hypothetical protein